MDNLRTMRVRLLTCWTLSCAAVAIIGPSAKADGRDGIDLIVLVDVSSSMYSPNKKRSTDPKVAAAPLRPEEYGSDFYRVRWDAVQLLLDLLTPNDRVLILRFNDRCPPQRPWYIRDDRFRSEGIIVGNKTTKRLFDFATDEFPGMLRHLTTEWRESLTEKTSLFNEWGQDAESLTIFDNADRRFEIKNVLDIGGTNILAALETAKARFDTTLSRERHILLLTDGVDDRINKDITADEARSEVIEQYLKEQDRVQLQLGSRNNAQSVHYKSVVVHTVGLKLDDITPDTLRSVARRALLQLASNSMGEHREIATPRDLVCMFRDLIRDIKGYWSPLAPSVVHANTQKEVSIPVAPGLQDLGILVYGEPSNLSPELVAKYPTQAPANMKLEWHDVRWRGGAPDVSAAAAHRFGKDAERSPRSLYEYIYIGPWHINESSDRLNDTPFAMLDADSPEPSTLKLSMDVRPYDQSAIILKRPVHDPFELVEPSLSNSKANLSRWDKLKVRVRMNWTEHFHHEDFKLVAYWRRFVERSRDDDRDDVACVSSSAFVGQAIPLHAALRNNDRNEKRPVFFEATLQLDDEKYSGISTNDSEDYELSIVIEGLTPRPGRPNILGGYWRRMQPITIRVMNDPLPLAQLPELIIDDDEPKTITITPAEGKYVAQSLPFDVVFIPPLDKTTEARLPLTYFAFEPALKEGHVQLSLMPIEASEVAQSSLTVALTDEGRNKIRRNSSNMPYEVGKLEVRSVDQRQGRSVGPATVSVRLARGLIPIQFSRAVTPLDTLGRSQSAPLSVRRVKPLQGDDGTHVSVSFDHQVMEEFGSDELWLEKIADGTGAQSVDLRLGEEFCVHFLPSSERAKVKRKIKYQLVASGPETDTAERSCELNIDQMEVQVAPAPVLFFANPGNDARECFDVTLLGGVDCTVYVATDAGEGEPVCHFRDDVLNVERNITVVGIPTEKEPLILKGHPAEQRPVVVNSQIELDVPKDIAPGVYRGTLSLIGNRTNPAEVKLELTVDWLMIDILEPRARRHRDAEGWETWKEDDPPETFVQLWDHREPEEYRLRVRRASGRPLRSGDVHLDAHSLKGATGKTFRGNPSVFGPVEEDGALTYRVTFNHVENYRSETYTGVVTVGSGKGASSMFLPFSETKREFKVMYVRISDLLK